MLRYLVHHGFVTWEIWGELNVLILGTFRLNLNVWMLGRIPTVENSDNMVIFSHHHQIQMLCQHLQILWTVHPQIQHVHCCTAWSHFITRTREAQELEGSGLHIFVSLKQSSSTCPVSFLAAPDTIHRHKFSLTCFTCLSNDLSNPHKTFGTRWIFTLRCFTAEWRINANPISHKLWAQIGWDQSHRDQSDRAWRPRAEKNWALTGFLGRIRIKYWKD